MNKKIKRTIELAYLKGLNEGAACKTKEEVVSHRIMSQVVAHNMYVKYMPKAATKQLLDTIISWEKDLSEYKSLETKLNELFLIYKL